MGQVDGSEEARCQGQGQASETCAEEVCGLPGGIVIAVILVFLAYLGLTIAKIAMGAIYIDDCPLELKIPIYLIVSGITTLILVVVEPILQLNKPTEGQAKERVNSIMAAIVALFTFPELITGSKLIFGNFSDAIDGCGGSSKCCSTKLINFAMAVTIIDWVLLGLMLVVCIVYCAFAIKSKVDAS